MMRLEKKRNRSMTGLGVLLGDDYIMARAGIDTHERRQIEKRDGSDRDDDDDDGDATPLSQRGHKAPASRNIRHDDG